MQDFMFVIECNCQFATIVSGIQTMQRGRMIMHTI
jgi:hypothetical protein